MERGPMPTEPLPGQTGAKMPEQAEPLCNRPDAPVQVSPDEQHGTATWVQAADPAGTVRASKEVPEPDSFGG
jgi:hypothetical protein